MRAALDRVYPRWEGLAVAGRTDAGVHALGQVSSFDADGGPPPERSAAALNTVLPDDVAAIGSEEAPPGFSARFSASGRSYRYRVWRRAASTRRSSERRSWWQPRAVDEEALEAAAAALLDRRARLPRLHADGDPARHLRPLRPRGAPGSATATPRLRDHRRQLPAPHGAHARRDDARAAIPTRSQVLLAGRPARPPARRRRPGASTWSVSSTRTRAEPSWIRSARCASRSSSSISTAPSSTPGRSSSPRSGMRRGRCSSARSPTVELLPSVGGPGHPDADAGDRAEVQADELVRVYREHNEPLHDELEAFAGMVEQVLAELKAPGPPARHRHREAAGDGRARVRRAADSGTLRRRRRRRRDRAAQAGSGAVLLALERLGASPAEAAYRRRLAVRHRRGAAAAGVFAIGVTWGGIHAGDALAEADAGRRRARGAARVL